MGKPHGVASAGESYVIRLALAFEGGCYGVAEPRQAAIQTFALIFTWTAIRVDLVDYVRILYQSSVEQKVRRAAALKVENQCREVEVKAEGASPMS